MELDLTPYSDIELLQLFGRVKRELTDRGIIRTNNLVGEYAEYIVCKALGLSVQTSSTKAIDAIGGDGKTYQIKARVWNGKTTPTIKSLRSFDFDFLVLVIFNDDFSIRFCGKLTPDQARLYSKLDSRFNEYRLNIGRRLIEDLNIINIDLSPRKSDLPDPCSKT